MVIRRLIEAIDERLHPPRPISPDLIPEPVPPAPTYTLPFAAPAPAPAVAELAARPAQPRDPHLSGPVGENIVDLGADGVLELQAFGSGHWRPVAEGGKHRLRIMRKRSAADRPMFSPQVKPVQQPSE